MTIDQACDEGREQERAEQLARAEAAIAEEIGDRHADMMAAGEICYECGEELNPPRGRPELCADCSGAPTTPSDPPRPPALALCTAEQEGDSPWFVGDQYFASATDASFWRRVRDARLARKAARAERLEIRKRRAA